MRSRFGLFGVLVVVVLALLVGGVAYNLGLDAGHTEVAAPGTVVYPVGYGHWNFGFGLFGIVFFFIIIGLLISAIRPRRWGGGHGWSGMGPGWRGGMGPGGWGANLDPNDPRNRDWTPRDVPPQFQPMLEAWHQRAHGTPPPTGTASGAGPTASGPSATPGSGPTAGA